VAYATANGSATSGTDYTAASGTLTFADGIATRTISVTINGDTVAEPTETFVVNLSNAANAVLANAQGLGTITNDDASITAAATTVSPGGTITLTIANGPGDPTDWVGLHGTADADTTYTHWVYLNGSRTVPATGYTTATIQLAAPMTPGTYNARLFASNGFTKLATSVTITVAP
jgi:hypothetical protein